MEGLTIATLTGKEAGHALRAIMTSKGRIFIITPLISGEGEKVWYQVGDRFACVRTDRVEEPSFLVGQQGTSEPISAFIEVFETELRALQEAGIAVGFSAERMLAIPA